MCCIVTIVAQNFLMFQCLCENCYLSADGDTVVLNSGRNLTVGHMTSCYLRPTGPAADLKPSYHYSMTIKLNAMLWPTLLFIIGFVNTFISSVYICKHCKDHPHKLKFYTSVYGESIV